MPRFMETLQHETLTGFGQLLQAETSQLAPALHTLAAADHRYLRDLKVNVSNALAYATLDKKSTYLLALAVAVNEKDERHTDIFRHLAATEGASEAEIAEVFACVSLMNINNVFYRFRHFTGKEFYETAPAGIKMSVMLNPVLGKTLFELASLMLSALNGCERCVKSHEASLIQLGCTEQQIYDTVRLGAILKGLMVLR